MLQLVIPAYNEENRLPRTLRELRRFVRDHRAVLGSVEVIVVDNASTDATAEVARAADSSALPVRVVACARRGKGAAVAAGDRRDRRRPRRLHGRRRRHPSRRAPRVASRLLALGVRRGHRVAAAAGSDTAARHSRLREAGARRYRALTGADRARHRRHPVRLQGPARRPGPCGVRPAAHDGLLLRRRAARPPALRPRWRRRWSACGWRSSMRQDLPSAAARGPDAGHGGSARVHDHGDDG